MIFRLKVSVREVILEIFKFALFFTYNPSMVINGGKYGIKVVYIPTRTASFVFLRYKRFQVSFRWKK